MSEETKAKISLALKGKRPKNLDQIHGWNKGTKGVMKANSGSFTSESQKGKKHSEATKRKISASHMGMRHSQEIIDKVKESRKGYKPTDETRRKMSQSMKARVSRGEHNFWKGGITPENTRQRGEFAKKYRPQVFERDNYTCQICGAYGVPIQVDHIKGWAKYPELRFNIDNCRTLCMACHYYVTFKRKMPKGTIWGHNFSKRMTK